MRRSRLSSNRVRARGPRATPETRDRSGNPPAHARIDVWLWRARFAKTRSLAAKLALSGHVRLNGRRVDAAGRFVEPGDTLTIALERTVVVIEIVALGSRRGPPAEARTLYRDLSDCAQDDNATR